MNHQQENSYPTIAILICLFTFFLAFYLLIYSGTFPTTDETAMFAAGASLAKRGELTINPLYWNPYGTVRINAAHEAYPSAEPAQIFLATPLHYVANHFSNVGNVHVVAIFNAIITAVTATLLFLYILELDYSLRTSLSLALIFGLATIALPYSKLFFREPLASLTFLGAAYFLLLMAKKGRTRYAIPFALWLGLSVATKEANVVAGVIFALLLPLYVKDIPTRKGRATAIILLLGPVVLGFLAMAAYNQFRSGNPLDSLHQVIDFVRPTIRRDTVIESIRSALLGFLFSPGKSYFVFTPVALASLVSFPLFWQERGREALLCATLAVGYTLFYAYARGLTWWGGLSWGPRYLLPITPFVIAVLAPLVERLWRDRPLWPTVAFGTLTILSFAVQMVGVAIDIRDYSAYLTQITPQAMWTMAIYEPFYSPPLWSLRLLRPANLNFAWIHPLGNRAQIDLAVVGATLGVILLAGAGVVYFGRYRRALSKVAQLTIAGGSLITLLSLIAFTLPRYYDDPRFGGGTDYQALLAYLKEASDPEDVMVLTNHGYMDFFLNYDKTTLNWYALVKEGPPLPELTVSLLERLIKRYSRIWLVVDSGPEQGLPRPVERWLTERTYKVQETQFSQYARLLLYSTTNLPDPKQPQHHTALKLGQAIELVGYDLIPNEGPAPFQHNQVVQLSLLWRTNTPLEENYTVFVQLLDESGQLRWQSDRYPVDGFRPTSTWAPGELIRDNYGFIVSKDLPAGQYQLITGMYHWPDLERLPVLAADGSSLGDHINLGTISLTHYMHLCQQDAVIGCIHLRTPYL